MTWMQIVCAILMVVGAWLSIWAQISLPPGTVDFPIPVSRRTWRGPYRWCRHPMYVGTIMLLTGLGGLGGGFWNALAFLILSELVMREWAWREDQ